MSIFQRLFGKREPQNTPDEEFDQWDAPLLEELRTAITRLMPAEWDSAVLILEVTDKGLGTGLSHSAITRTQGEDFVLQDDQFIMPDMDVMAATRKLELAWIERGDTFQKAIITLWRHDQAWGIRSIYEG